MVAYLGIPLAAT